MNETSSRQFGLIVAYLLPGFIGLAGIAPLFPAVARWLVPVDQVQGGLGPAVYALLAATTIGMIVSCIRWLVIDHVHHLTGVQPPVWDDTMLDDRLGAFNYIVEAHYRYYQFYGNVLVAIVWAYGVNRLMGTVRFLGAGTDLEVLFLCSVLFAGSRDALGKYYRRTGRLMGLVTEKGDAFMTNGNHHGQESGAGASSIAPRKPVRKATTPAPPHSPPKDVKSQK